MKTLGIVLLWLSSVGVALYALAAYTLLTPGTTVHPQMKAVYAEERWGIMLHVLGAFCALFFGPAQFSRSLRARSPRLHRALGRVYLFAGVLVGGGAGLYMSFHAFGVPSRPPASPRCRCSGCSRAHWRFARRSGATLRLTARG